MRSVYQFAVGQPPWKSVNNVQQFCSSTKSVNMQQSIYLLVCMKRLQTKQHSRPTSFSCCENKNNIEDEDQWVARNLLIRTSNSNSVKNFWRVAFVIKFLWFIELLSINVNKIKKCHTITVKQLLECFNYDFERIVCFLMQNTRSFANYVSNYNSTKEFFAITFNTVVF